MTQLPDHEFEVLEDDENVPPRPEELIADAEDAPLARTDQKPRTPTTSTSTGTG